ncbi:MAG: T9SS type A sorting domain-containing protein [Bacteroidales bacterium]|nr:T9SS type A sorting domain-containing protein [Bacteroidales bacterium]
MKRILRITLVLAMMLGASGQFAGLRADDRIEVAQISCSATPTNGGIKLTAESETTFDIYSITGQRIKTIAVNSGTEQINLPKGCYIVKCAQWSKKVIVK